MGIFDSLFKDKSSQEPLRGAAFQLQCSGLLPSNYYRAAKKIEAMGLKGVMRTTKEGNIMIEVEGTHSMIEKLMKNLDHNLFVCPCQNELVWLPFANKYRGFFANAFVASESPPCDKRKT